MDSLVDVVIRKLKKAYDPVRVKQAESYYPTSLQVLGVKVPDQREVVKWLRAEPVEPAKDAFCIKICCDCEAVLFL